MGSRALKPMMALLLAAVVAGVLLVLLGPKAIGWLVGGAVAGGATVARARRRNADAQADHRAASAINAERIEAANARGAEAARAASEDPGPATEAPETVEDEEARRAALRSASDRLRG